MEKGEMMSDTTSYSHCPECGQKLITGHGCASCGWFMASANAATEGAETPLNGDASVTEVPTRLKVGDPIVLGARVFIGMTEVFESPCKAATVVGFLSTGKVVLQEDDGAFVAAGTIGIRPLNREDDPAGDSPPKVEYPEIFTKESLVRTQGGGVVHRREGCEAVKRAKKVHDWHYPEDKIRRVIEHEAPWLDWCSNCFPSATDADAGDPRTRTREAESINQNPPATQPDTEGEHDADV